jgi:hypothetical protein
MEAPTKNWRRLFHSVASVPLTLASYIAVGSLMNYLIFMIARLGGWMPVQLAIAASVVTGSIVGMCIAKYISSLLLPMFNPKVSFVCLTLFLIGPVIGYAIGHRTEHNEFFLVVGNVTAIATAWLLFWRGANGQIETE